MFDKRLTPAVPSWSLHDLRRTWATMVAEFAPPHIVERVLNRSSGTISGAATIYNRQQYLPEMREAAEKWEAHLASLL
jgi:hypothetical protein